MRFIPPPGGPPRARELGVMSLQVSSSPSSGPSSQTHRFPPGCYPPTLQRLRNRSSRSRTRHPCTHPGLGIPPPDTVPGEASLAAGRLVILDYRQAARSALEHSLSLGGSTPGRPRTRLDFSVVLQAPATILLSFCISGEGLARPCSLPALAAGLLLHRLRHILAGTLGLSWAAATMQSPSTRHIAIFFMLPPLVVFTVRCFLLSPGLGSKESVRTIDESDTASTPETTKWTRRSAVYNSRPCPPPRMRSARSRRCARRSAITSTSTTCSTSPRSPTPTSTR